MLNVQSRGMENRYSSGSQSWCWEPLPCTFCMSVYMLMWCSVWPLRSLSLCVCDVCVWVWASGWKLTDVDEVKDEYRPHSIQRRSDSHWPGGGWKDSETSHTHTHTLQTNSQMIIPASTEGQERLIFVVVLTVIVSESESPLFPWEHLMLLLFWLLNWRVGVIPAIMGLLITFCLIMMIQPPHIYK